MDERAKEYIAKRVSKMNGDIRVAFDIVKSALNVLKQTIEDKMSYEDNEVPELIMKQEIVNRVYMEKYGSNLPAVLKAMPR